MRHAILQFVLAASCIAGYRTQYPALARKVAPAYTAQAARAGVEGTVLLYAEVGADGRAHRMRVIKGLGYGLDQQAIEAVRQWEFYPGTKNGVPANTTVTVEVVFHLAGPSSRV